MAKLNQKEIAQKTALEGDAVAAEAAFKALVAAGDVGANAALAEFAAYRGAWAEVLDLVEPLFAAPTTIYTQNVYQDMVSLTARAGQEMKAWPRVRNLAKLALSKLSAKTGEARIAAIRELDDFAQRAGKGSYLPAGIPEAERKKRFDDAVAQMVKSKEKRFRKPAERTNHLFALARATEYYAGAVSVFDQEKSLPFIFDNVVFAASALTRVGRGEEAWTAVTSSLNLWWPVEVTQVAPVVLLTDEFLRTVMTPERCQTVIQSPRGPGAAGKRRR
jgi:hypothetical protein